jgi:lipopolysaccharide/colanic/teichoic acid biosynthesis glycosyltransferase
MTAPLLAVFGALISLDSEGPALFFQPRTGLGQRPFTMVKLRTMDADKRVTAVGRWLRPMGLDELPQLWNVLRGDMSFIGPRPEVLSRVERYRCELPGYDTRHAVRPGITGLAQVRGLRGDNTGTIEERLKFDLQYVDEWSLRLDAQIAAWTIPRVLIDTIRARRG